MSTDDPWLWTVNELIAELCHSSALFKAVGCRAENYPDAATLEDQLRDQGVTGLTFLTALDSETLRSELGIQNLGQRMVIAAVIDLLRGRSPAYKQHAATAGVQALNLENQYTSAAAEPPRLTPPIPIMNNAINSGGRKRQKVTHVSTLPLPVNKQHSPSHPNISAIMPGGEPIVDGSGAWDYLLRWQESGQQVIDLEALAADEMVDEEDSIDIDEAPEDDPQERLGETAEVEAVPGRSKLSTKQIVDIINERIEHYTSIWKPGKGITKEEEMEYNPIKMWDRAEADGERLVLIKKHEMEHEYFKQRLDKLCKEIEDYAGNSVDILRRQCGTLEVTIDSMLLAEWLADIYRLPPDEGSEDDEKQLHNRSPGTDDLRSQPHPAVTPLRTTPAPPEIIDLGSPSESSQEQPEETVNDSSPLPGVHNMERRSSSTDQFHTPHSGITQTVEPVDEAPAQLQVPTPVATASPTRRLRPWQQHGDAPESASIVSARRWTWPELVEYGDRKRIVTKAIQKMKTEDRETIRDRLRTVGKADMVREILACIRMLAKGESKMPGVLGRDMPKIVTFTRLFLCWWLCDNYFRAEIDKWHLEELEQCLEEGSPDPGTFCDYVSIIMTTTFSLEALSNPEQPSQAEIIDIPSDDNEPPPRPASQRKPRTQRSQASQRSTVIVLD